MIDADRFDELAGELNHPEGVAWDPTAGCVYAGGEDGEIYQVTLDGEVIQVGSSGGSMLGIAVDGRGRVYACDDGQGEVARWDPVAKEMATYARGVDGADMDCPNVAAFGPDGVLYVTCSGEAGNPEILRIAPGGEPVERWTGAVPGYPNGALVTPDGSALIVVESHAQRLVRVAIGADGAAGDVSVIASLPGTDADGVGLASDGSLWVTLYRPDGLTRVAPDGSVEVVLDDHLAQTFDAPTNIAWVGSTLDRVVVANVGDRFLSIGDVGVAGQPLHYPVLD
ncbi:MAG: SMP-30/gluconolactonase/LRE family protein [Actinomycetota bacterium]